MHEQIISLLETLASSTNSDVAASADTQTLECTKFKVVITMNDKWLGIEFTAFIVNGSNLFYFTDTDNYDISKKENEWFLNEIAADIELLLTSLTKSSVLVGTYKNRPAMIIPKTNGFARIAKSKLSGYAIKDFQKLEDAKVEGIFAELSVS